MKKILYDFSIDSLTKIVNESNSFSEVTSRLGLDPQKGNCKKNIERLVRRNNISVEHFDSVKRLKNAKLKYSDKELLKKLVLKSNTFKDVLLNLDLLPIESNYNTLKKYLNLYGIDYNHISLNHKRNKTKSDYSYVNLLSIVESSNSIAEVLKKIGLSTGNGNYKTIKEYLRIHNINTSHFKRSYECLRKTNKRQMFDILVDDSTYLNTNNLKNRLFDEGIKERKCEKCGQDENWHGEHISLILDHINGKYNDNRLENLRILCPNCNATLPTHCGKNMKKTLV